MANYQTKDESNKAASQSSNAKEAKGNRDKSHHSGAQSTSNGGRDSGTNKPGNKK